MKDFLKSLGSAKLAIALFFILAGISILGTLIPQGQPQAFYIWKYGNTLGRLIIFFQLHDAYHSWWYIASLLLFLVNLTVCSYNRLPLTLRLYRRDPEDINPEKLPNNINYSLNCNISKILDKISQIGFKKSSKKSTEGYLFYKKINWFSFFSVYIVHFSLVVVILGALIGAIFGYRGNISIIEGESSNVVYPFRKADPIYLDFHIKLNKFILETYPNGMPKEYISNITIIDGNQTVDAIIKVNQPFKYKDITFYQASYNVIPEFKVKIRYNGKLEEKVLSPFQPLNLEDRYSIAVQDYGEAHGFIYIRIWALDEQKGESQEAIVISGFPPSELKFYDNEIAIEYVDIEKLHYMTGLQAKTDPGNFIVYIGFILMILGLFLVYYFEPRIYWIYVKPKDSIHCELILGAYSKREREGIKVKLEKLADEIINK